MTATGAERVRPRLRRLQPAAIGAVALSVSNMLRMGVQLAMLPILARLVGPAEYGLVSLAVPFVLFCNMLADAGMNQALGRRQDATVELESTVFWLAGGLGAGLMVLAALTAWPLALLLGQPRLPPLILALSPILLMSGLTAVANARVIREGRFGIFAGGDFASTTISAGVALWAALNGAGAWSLVAQQLTMWVIKSAWTNLSVRPTIRFFFRWNEVKSLVRFGLHQIGANLSDFIARNADNMILGGVLGATALGYYAMAYQIARMPDLIISGPLFLYIFTAVARAAHDEGRGSAGDLAVSALRLAGSALAPTFVGLAFVAPLAVDLILGEQWTPAGPVLSHLSAAGFGFSSCIVMSAIVTGLGHSHIQFRMMVLAALTTITTIGLTARLGVETASLAIGAAILGLALVYLEVLARTLQVARSRLLAAYAPGGGSAAVMAVALMLLRPLVSHLPALVELPLTVAAGGLVYLAALAAVGRRKLVADARVFGRAHARA